MVIMRPLVLVVVLCVYQQQITSCIAFIRKGSLNEVLIPLCVSGTRIASGLFRTSLQYSTSTKCVTDETREPSPDFRGRQAEP